METLFGSYKVTADDLGKIPGTSPVLKSWSGLAFIEGKVEVLVNALVQFGKAKDVPEALVLLNEYSKQFNPEAVIINSSDLKAGKFKRIWKLLERIVEEERNARDSQENRRDRHFGRIGHEAIPRLFLRELPRAEDLRRYVGKEDSPELIGNTLAGSHYIGKLLNERSSRGYVQEVNECVQEAYTFLEQYASWIEQYDACRKYFKKLVDMLMPVFGTYIDSVLQLGNDAYTRYFALLTLISWGHALVYHYDKHVYQEKRRVFIREVPVLHSRHGVAGWRSDGVELLSVNGVNLNPSQTDVALRFARTREFRSVGEVARGLQKLFRGDITLGILEWKFGVGDGTGKRQVIGEDQLSQGPLRQHLKQVQRYIALACADILLARGGHVWQNECVANSTIMYFLSGGVRSYHIALEPLEQESLFVKEVVDRLPKGKQKATNRTFENYLVRIVINLLQGKPSRNNVQSNGGQESLFSSDMERLIAHYRSGQ